MAPCNLTAPAPSDRSVLLHDLLLPFCVTESIGLLGIQYVEPRHTVCARNAALVGPQSMVCPKVINSVLEQAGMMSVPYSTLSGPEQRLQLYDNLDIDINGDTCPSSEIEYCNTNRA